MTLKNSLKIAFSTVIITLVAQNAIAQKLPALATIGAYSKGFIVKEIEKDIKKYNSKNDSSLIYYESSTGDTVYYFQKYPIEKVKIMYVFQTLPFDDYEKYCIKQEFTFECSLCSETHLRQYIKQYKFKKITDNHYISKYWWRTELIISRNPNNEQCLTMTFTYSNRDKKEYKKLYYSLH